MKFPIHVTVKTHVRIHGCPQRGLTAIDYRRSVGLPDDRADHLYPLEGEITSEGSDEAEAQIRRLVEAGYSVHYDVAGQGLISLEDGGHCQSAPSVRAYGTDRTHHGASYGWRARVRPETLLAGLYPSLLELAADSPQREREEEERAEQAERIQREAREARDRRLARRAELAAQLAEAERELAADAEAEEA